MRKFIENVFIYFITIMHPRLVIDMVHKRAEAVEMLNHAYKTSKEALELTSKYITKLKLLEKQSIQESSGL